MDVMRKYRQRAAQAERAARKEQKCPTGYANWSVQEQEQKGERVKVKVVTMYPRSLEQRAKLQAIAGPDTKVSPFGRLKTPSFKMTVANSLGGVDTVAVCGSSYKITTPPSEHHPKGITEQHWSELQWANALARRYGVVMAMLIRREYARAMNDTHEAMAASKARAASKRLDRAMRG